MTTPFRVLAQDPERRPALRHQVLQDLEHANEQLAELQQARQHVPPDSHLELEWLDCRFKLRMDRDQALVRLKILDNADTTRAQRWAKRAEEWLAVAAMWTVMLYGFGGAVLLLMSAGPGAAALHQLKAIAIAITGFWLGRRLCLLLARR